MNIIYIYTHISGLFQYHCAIFWLFICVVGSFFESYWMTGTAGFTVSGSVDPKVETSSAKKRTRSMELWSV